MRVSVREAFASRGLVMPATHFKNQTRNRDRTPCVRSVREQSFTVCASHALTWCDREGKTHKVMTARESAVLMGFGRAWRLPKGSRNAQRAVGNALCVAMSKASVQAAVALCTGTPIPTVPLLSTPPQAPQAPTSPPEPPAPPTLAEQPSTRHVGAHATATYRGREDVNWCGLPRDARRVLSSKSQSSQ